MWRNVYLKYYLYDTDIVQEDVFNDYWLKVSKKS